MKVSDPIVGIPRSLTILDITFTMGFNRNIELRQTLSKNGQIDIDGPGNCVLDSSGSNYLIMLKTSMQLVYVRIGDSDVEMAKKWNAK